MLKVVEPFFGKAFHSGRFSYKIGVENDIN